MSYPNLEFRDYELLGGESEFPEEYMEELDSMEVLRANGMESPFTEEEEMELAAELLSLTSEAELDQFLGRLFKRVWRGIQRVAGPVVRTLGGVLKRVAKVGLPIAGRLIGTYFGGPVGGAIGGKLAGAAGRLFGLELEGLSAEDQEFELARRFVRLAGATARNLALIQPTGTPRQAVMQALTVAARKFAPGLLRLLSGQLGETAPYYQMPFGMRGHWIRRGRVIILFGV